MKKLDCLQTPPWVYEPLQPFDLDPCSGPDTQIAHRNYALERGDDGLRDPWCGFVWCNPPFSQKSEWIQKMQSHRNGILILPERGSAPWFGPLARNVGQYFVMGKRVNFVGGPSSNNCGSVLFLFGGMARRRVVESGLPGHLVCVEYFNPREKRDEINGL